MMKNGDVYWDGQFFRILMSGKSYILSDANGDGHRLVASKYHSSDTHAYVGSIADWFRAGIKECEPTVKESLPHPRVPHKLRKISGLR